MGVWVGRDEVSVAPYNASLFYPQVGVGGAEVPGVCKAAQGKSPSLLPLPSSLHLSLLHPCPPPSPNPSLSSSLHGSSVGRGPTAGGDDRWWRKTQRLTQLCRVFILVFYWYTGCRGDISQPRSSPCLVLLTKDTFALLSVVHNCRQETEGGVAGALFSPCRLLVHACTGQTAIFGSIKLSEELI